MSGTRSAAVPAASVPERMRARLAGAIFVAASPLLVACTSDAETAGSTILLPNTTTTSTAPPTTLPPPPPTTLVAPEHVHSCVEYTQFQAFLGEPFWLQAWEDANRDEDQLRAQCESAGRDDPSVLANVHAAWQEILAGVPTTTRELFDDP